MNFIVIIIAIILMFFLPVIAFGGGRRSGKVKVRYGPGAGFYIFRGIINLIINLGKGLWYLGVYAIRYWYLTIGVLASGVLTGFVIWITHFIRK